MYCHSRVRVKERQKVRGDKDHLNLTLPLIASTASNVKSQVCIAYNCIFPERFLWLYICDLAYLSSWNPKRTVYYGHGLTMLLQSTSRLWQTGRLFWTTLWQQVWRTSAWGTLPFVINVPDIVNPFAFSGDPSATGGPLIQCLSLLCCQVLWWRDINKGLSVRTHLNAHRHTKTHTQVTWIYQSHATSI